MSRLGRRRRLVLRSTAATVVVIAAMLAVATNIATAQPLPQWAWLSNRPLLWSLVAGLTLVAVVLAVMQHRLADEPAPRSSDDLDAAATNLATTVGQQWADEAARRQLRNPDPIRVRWSDNSQPN